MRAFRIAAAAGLACIGTGALATDWRMVAESDLGIGYVDADSVRREGDRVVFTGTVFYTDPASEMVRSTTRYQGECVRSTVQVTERSVYLRDGRRDSWAVDEPGAPVVPESNLHYFLRAACERVWPGGTIADLDADAAAAVRRLRRGK